MSSWGDERCEHRGQREPRWSRRHEDDRASSDAQWRHPGRFIAFVRMDYIGDGNPDRPETWDVHSRAMASAWDRLTEAVRQGASGLKLLKDLGLTLRGLDGKLIVPDDPRFDPVWQRAGELKIPVLWHCADPRPFFQPISEQKRTLGRTASPPGMEFPWR